MNTQKRNNIIYWIATILLTLGMLGTAFSQIFQEEGMVAYMAPLGYPLYVLYILGIAKVLAVIVILLPGLKLVKEWSYAGLFFVMVGAIASHVAIGDLVGITAPFFQSAFIALSWYFRPANRKLS